MKSEITLYSVSVGFKAHPNEQLFPDLHDHACSITSAYPTEAVTMPTVLIKLFIKHI